MNIRPSAVIRKNYNEVSELCKQSKEPVFLTKNGEGDLVVMDMETYSRRESMLKLREALVLADEDRLSAKRSYSVEEAAALLRDAVTKTADHA
jgi:PHD/YefM family antitoxin component YafN of YafNO toxin-antitoxin module